MPGGRVLTIAPGIFLRSHDRAIRILWKFVTAVVCARVSALYFGEVAVHDECLDFAIPYLTAAKLLKGTICLNSLYLEAAKPSGNPFLYGRSTTTGSAERSRKFSKAGYGGVLRGPRLWNLKKPLPNTTEHVMESRSRTAQPPWKLRWQRWILGQATK